MDDFIHNFVHSLNLSEKAYFKKFASFHHGNQDKNYLRLYALLMKQPQFSEEELTPELDKIGLAKYYGSEQNYLYRQLMTSLINFHFENTTYRKLTKQILAINLLMEKGFRKKANKVLRKAKKLATDLEEFSILLKLVQLEEEILFREGILNFTKKLQELKNERQRIMLIIENYSDLRLLREQIRELQYKIKYVHETDELQYKDLMAPSLMSDPSNALSNKAKSHWLYVKMSIANLRLDFRQSADMGYQTLDLIRQHPALFPPMQSAVTISNLLFDAVLLCDRRLFDDLMKQLKAQTSVSPNYLIYVEYVRKLRFGIFNQDWDLLRDTVGPANHFMVNHNKLIEAAQRGNLFLLLVASWMELGKFNEAVELLNVWEQLSDKKLYLAFRRMARLISYYELKWHNLLESEIQSAYKVLKKHGVYEKREQVLMAFFRVVIKKSTHQKQALFQLREKLTVIEENPNLKLFYPAFNYLRWATNTKG